MNPALQGLLTIAIGVGGCIGYFFFANQFLDKVLFPNRSLTSDQARRRRLFAMLGLVGIPALAFVWFVLLPAVSAGAFTARVFWSVLASVLVVLLLAYVVNLLFPAGEQSAGRNITRANQIRPWVFLFPAMFALGLYLAYPVFETLRLSVTDRSQGGAFVGFANYQQMMADAKFWEAMRNNMLWLLVVPAASTAFGLLAAQLTDRISWGNIAKSLIFMPMAISFVGASVIFKLVYDARPVDVAQIGVLNAVWLQFEGGAGSLLMLRVLPAILLVAFAAAVAYVAWTILTPLWAADRNSKAWHLPLRVLAGLGAAWLVFLSVRSVVSLFGADFPYGEPQQWLTVPFWNNFFLMVVLIWIQTGFAMVILSAAIRGIPEETVEAAIVDGANPLQIFFKIKVPQIMPTIVVVWTTITLVVLKVFDIVFAMTNGQWGTQILANYMYSQLFVANDWGVGSASAIVIMLLVSPILIWNVYNARKEMR